MARKNSLTVAELKGILKACGEAKVTVLQFGDLRVEFGLQAGTQAPDPSPMGKSTRASTDTALSPASAAAMAETQRQIAERRFLEDEAAHKEDQLAQMWITDPVQAERLLIEGGLAGESTESDDEEA